MLLLKLVALLGLSVMFSLLFHCLSGCSNETSSLAIQTHSLCR